MRIRTSLALRISCVALLPIGSLVGTSAMAAPASPDHANSAEVPWSSAVPSIVCPDGWTYYGQAKLPVNFDPRQYSSQELESLGLPPAPPDPSLDANWLKMIQHPAPLECPKTTTGPDRYVTGNNYTWAGYVANSNANLTDAEGYATIPKVVVTGNGNQEVAGWAGVNLGNGAGDPLCQTGYTSWSDTTNHAKVWWEEVWNGGGYPPSYAPFTVNTNDSIYMHASYSGTTCSVHLIDYTSGNQGIQTARTLAGTSKDGHAEMIAERQNGGYLSQPASGSSIQFTTVQVAGGSGWQNLGSVPNYAENMSSGNCPQPTCSTVIAYPSWNVPSTNAFTVHVTGTF